MPSTFTRQCATGPGFLDRKVVIQTAATGGAWGGSDPDWTNPSAVATVWARKIFRRGREALDGATIHAQAMVVWEMHYRTDVTTAHRIADGTEYFDIVAIDDERKLKGWMEVHCTEWKA